MNASQAKEFIQLINSANPNMTESKILELAASMQSLFTRADMVGGSVGTIQMTKEATLSDTLVDFTHKSNSQDVDIIDTDVQITRGQTQWLYNPLFDQGAGASTPTNTEWKYLQGALVDWSVVDGFAYDTLYNEVQNNLGTFGNLPNTDWVMHDTVNDKYYYIKFITWQAGGGGGFHYTRQQIIITKDGIIHFADGSTMKTAPTVGANDINVGNTVFVDSVNGSNNTGARGKQNFPFSTISAAQAVAQFGDQIRMRAGTYVDTFLGMDGINYHYEAGAKHITSAYTYYNYSNISFSVTGYGEFINNAGICVYQGGAGTSVVTFNCMSITCNGSARGVWFIGLQDSKMYVNVIKNITSENETCIRMRLPVSNAECHINVGGNIESKCVAIESTYQDSNDGVGAAKMYVRANKIKMLDGGGQQYVLLYITSGELHIHADLESKVASVYNYPMLAIEGSKTDFYGKIDFDGAGTEQIQNFGQWAGGSEITYHEEVKANGSVSMDGGQTRFKGKLINSWADNAAFTHRGGKVYFEHLVFNTNGGNNAHGINVQEVGVILLSGASIFVNTNGQAKSLYSATGYSVQVYPSVVANFGTTQNITQLISTITVNTDIDNQQ